MQRGSGAGKLKKVSQTYDPYTPARRVDCNVTFEAVNTVAQNSATVRAPITPNVMSNMTQLFNGKRAQKTFASCEQSATLLNGKYSFLPDDLSDYEMGYISKAASDAAGENPRAFLSITFSASVTLSGFTIAFEPES